MAFSFFLRIGVAAIAMAAAGGWAAPADEVRTLLEQGKPREAYDTGRRHSAELGNSEFDFFFGIAAIEAGHSGEGVLALERYLLNHPDNVSARMMLARGYFALGENARAREEFEALLQAKPPADAVATIERYLDAIRTRETRYTTTTGAYVEVGFGHDSNINSGVSGASITLPALGPILVGSAGQKTSSPFLTLAAGGYVSHPVAPGIAVFATAAGDRRFHDSSGKTQFEQGNFGVAGGVSVLREKNLYRFSGSYGVLTVGNPRYRTVAGVSAEWQHQFDEQQAFNAGLQAAQLDHPDPNGPRDAEFYGINAGYRLLFSHAWQPTLAFGLSYGQQHSRTGRPDLVPRTWGASLGLSFTPAAKWGASVGYQFQQGDYRGPDVILGETRVDRYHAVNGSLAYYHSRSLSFRGEVQVVRNESNIELYSFPREIASFKVRYEFK